MLTDYAAKFLATNAPNSSENPFWRQNGKCVLRADMFEVTPHYDMGIFKGYIFRYFWHGNVVSTQHLDSNNPRDPFTLRGVELRYTVDLSGAGGLIAGLKGLKAR